MSNLNELGLPFPEPITRDAFSTSVENFDAENFLLSQSEHQTLSDLRSELRSMLNLLRNDLVNTVESKVDSLLEIAQSVTNDNLSESNTENNSISISNLNNFGHGGLQGIISDARVSLVSVQRELFNLENNLKENLKSTQAAINERKIFAEQERNARNIYNLLLIIVELETKIEELQRTIQVYCKTDNNNNNNNNSNSQLQEEKDLENLVTNCEKTVSEYIHVLTKLETFKQFPAAITSRKELFISLRTRLIQCLNMLTKSLLSNDNVNYKMRIFRLYRLLRAENSALAVFKSS